MLAVIARTSLAAYAYDDLGNRTSLTFANGVSQAFAFDPVARLASLTNDVFGTAQDLAKTFAYNPASQITSETKSADTYAFAKANVSETGTANGLNQLTQYAAKTLSHDAKGNVTGFGSDTFAYSSANLLTSATVAGTGTTLAYDPLTRLYQTVSGSTTSRFALRQAQDRLYDGLDAIAEYNAGGTLQRRWVFDPTTGQPLVWYEGTGTGSTVRRYLSANELGSIVSVSDSNGIGLAINKYDEFGIPSLSAYSGRYGYTGQAWIGSAQLWHYKARAYHPGLGRFLQPDPIGYWDSPNLYAYVLNDPVNLVDPLGSCIANGGGPGVNTPEYGFENCGDVTVTGERSLVWLADLGVGEFVFKGGNRGFEPILRVPRADSSLPAQPNPPNTCPTNAGQEFLRDVADVSDALALGSGLAAAVSAPTGVGALAFGSLAIAAKTVSFGANAIIAVDQAMSGDLRGAAGTAAGWAAGALGPAGALRGMTKIGHSSLGPNAQKALAEGFSWPASEAAELAVSGCKR